MTFLPLGPSTSDQYLGEWFPGFLEGILHLVFKKGGVLAPLPLSMIHLVANLNLQYACYKS